MPEAREKWREFAFEEAYEVVRVVVVVKGRDTYRIEVLKSYSRQPAFNTRCWIETDAILQPRVAERVLERVLVEYDLPSAMGDDSEAVLAQALGFLRDGLHQE